MMKAEEYFEYMKVTSETVDNYKNAIIWGNTPGLTAKRDFPSRLGTYERGPSRFYQESIQPIMHMLFRRESKKKTRAVFLRACYEILSPTTSIHEGHYLPLHKRRVPNMIVEYCACAELLLDYMYYFNQVYDRKGGDIDVVQNTVAGILSQVAVDNHLQDKQCLLDKDLARIVGKEFNSVVNAFTFLGQWFDHNDCVYRGNEHLALDEMLDLTIQRMSFINAKFYVSMAKVAGYVAGVHDLHWCRPRREDADENLHKWKLLQEFGLAYGIAQQIVNDIADFVPPQESGGIETTEKTSSDSYRDIMAGKLTPPVIYGLHMASVNERKIVEDALVRGWDTPLDQLIEITRILNTSGAIQESKKLARRYIGKSSKMRKKMRKTLTLEERQVLSLMCIMVDSNRFYNVLKEYE